MGIHGKPLPRLINPDFFPPRIAAEAGHGGMDYIMMYDLIDAIRNKKPAPMDCYDAAAWSAISGLSEMSIARGGALVDFPDFTRGQWIHRQPQFAL